MRDSLSEENLMEGKQLFDSKKRFVYLVKSMPTAAYITDPEGWVTFYNKKAIELWGRQPSLNNSDNPRYCGSHKVYKHDGTSLPLEQSWMAIALRTQREVTDKEVIFERPDGSRVIVLVNISPLFDEGEFVGAINVMMDITKQKSIEQDVHRLAAIVDSSNDAIVSKTLSGIVTSWNKGAEQILGYTEEEMVGRHITTIIPPERYHEENIILSRIRRGEKIEHFESIRVTKDGRKLPISLTISPIKDDEGRVIGASKIARDISEQINNTKRLKKLNKELQKLNRHKDEFIGMASHELKTPITVVRSNLELLNLQLNDEKLQPLIDKTLNNVGKLTALVSNLLDISKIEGGKVQLSSTGFDLIELINECVRTMQVSAPSHKFILEQKPSSLAIYADRQRLEQVVINLLNNAVKYSPNADKVIINIQTANEEVVISVKDFGIGIPEELQEKVFSRFFRAGNLPTAYDGLGIGLFISKDIIERHKGEIWIESEEGVGSTFYFKLPLNEGGGSSTSPKHKK